MEEWTSYACIHIYVFKTYLTNIEIIMIWLMLIMIDFLDSGIHEVQFYAFPLEYIAAKLLRESIMNQPEAWPYLN